MRHKGSFIVLGFAFILSLMLSGCEMNRLKSAEKLYEKENYLRSIEAADFLINNGVNGAVVTRAELLRAENYLQLGLKALEADNRPLAIRLFKLSNSAESDKQLANLYLSMSTEADKAGDNLLSMRYLEDILRETQDSELVPQVLQKRVELYVDGYYDYNSAWEEYKNLYDYYPENEYELLAREKVKSFISSRLGYADMLYESGYYADALKELSELSQYPIVEADDINLPIANVYHALAEDYLDQQNYLEADRLFHIALQYDPTKEAAIKSRLEGMIAGYITEGEKYEANRQFDLAEECYRKSFEIIAGYSPAEKALSRLAKKREDIAKAAAYIAEAEALEKAYKYSDAVVKYNLALQLDNLPEYRAKAAISENMVEAEKNPLAFAKKILAEYGGGIISKRVEAKRTQLLKDYKENEVSDSGWKFMLSTGQYKYEARYDLLTPDNTYLYVWQISLRDRNVIPLNKLSEALMK